MDLEARLPQLLPRAVAWAEAVAAEVDLKGDPLGADGLAVASAVGVREASRVRVLQVPQLPVPEDPELQAAALATGLLGPDALGLTLGYAVLIREGELSRRLLSHECRHVHQFEQSGGIADFLPLYLQSIVECGYWDSPYEQDARAHELPDLPPAP